MLKRMGALLLLTLFLALLFTSCAPESTRPTGGTGASDLPQTETGDRPTGENHRYLTLWSWQIPGTEQMELYAQKAVECGFTAVDLGVLWAHFEPLRGHFDWTWMDAAVRIFSGKGLAVSLQPLLWSKDLSWGEDLAFQESRQGVFAVEDRGSFVSFTDGETLNIVKNTLQNFALRASGYGAAVIRWGVRLSAFGEGDYSVNADLDYSESAARAFCDYLREIYGDVTEFSRVSGLDVYAWSDLDRRPVTQLADSVKGDWRCFRARMLEEFLATASGIFRSADPDLPIVFMLGTFGNGMNNSFTGPSDLWRTLSELDFDLLGVSFSTDVDPSMALSCITSLTDKPLCVEVDGAGVWEEGDEEEAKSRVALCAAYGVEAMATANFTLEQLETHKSTLLAFRDLFAPSGLLTGPDPTKAILIFSRSVGSQNPPRSFDGIYGDVWKILSENGARRVRFVTEEQIASGATLPAELTDFYCGSLTGDLPVSQAFAESFLQGERKLHGTGIALVLPDGTHLPEELNLSGRIVAE